MRACQCDDAITVPLQAWILLQAAELVLSVMRSGAVPPDPGSAAAGGGSGSSSASEHSGEVAGDHAVPGAELAARLETGMLRAARRAPFVPVPAAGVLPSEASLLWVMCRDAQLGFARTLPAAVQCVQSPAVSAATAHYLHLEAALQLDFSMDETQHAAAEALRMAAMLSNLQHAGFSSLDVSELLLAQYALRGRDGWRTPARAVRFCELPPATEREIRSLLERLAGRRLSREKPSAPIKRFHMAQGPWQMAKLSRQLRSMSVTPRERAGSQDLVSADRAR